MPKLFIVVIAAAIAGCSTVSSTSDVDRRHGSAVNAAKAQQTLDPNASRNTDPVAGIDGPAAKGAIDLYQKTYRDVPGVIPGTDVTRHGARGKH